MKPASAPLDEQIQDSQERIGREGRRFDLGLLLVHGIGEQQRGDTLTEAGDRLIDWLRRNVEADEQHAQANGKTPRELTLLDVVLRQASDDAVPAAHAVVRIGHRDDEEDAVYWVIAEAWWADVFRGASFLEVAFWGVTVGHWVFATQIQAIRQRMQLDTEVRTWLRVALLPIFWLVGTATVLLAGALSLVLTVFALVLLPLALSRIPLLASAAGTLQRTLAGGVGDAYVLTRSPLRFGAMASQVRSDLQTLRRAADSVAVVAHSQGTAVAWAALRRELLGPQEKARRPDELRAPIGLFLTYGQAVRKLTFMVLVARGDRDRGRGALAAAANSVLLVIATALFLLGAPIWVIVLTLYLAIVVEFGLLVVSDRIQERTTNELLTHWQRMRKAEDALRWLDLWASADPVPVGALGLTAPGVASYKIQNLASIVLDHVTYWKNSTEFMEPLASQMHTLGDPASGRAQPVDSPRLQVAAMRRHARVHVLLGIRATLLASIVAGAAAAWFSPAFAVDVMAFLRRIPLVGDLLGTPPDWAQSLAGVLAVLAVSAIAWQAMTAAWGALAGRDEADYVAESDAGLWAGVHWQLLGAAAILFALFVSWKLADLNHPVIAILYVVVAPLTVLLALIVFSSGGRTLYSGTPEQGVVLTAPTIRGSSLLGALDVLVAISLLIALPVAMLQVRGDLAVWALLGEFALIETVLLVEGLRQYAAFHRTFKARLAELTVPET